MKLLLLGKSGTGKSTQEKNLSNYLKIPRIVSTTSRPSRPGEKDGIDYHFVKESQFLGLIENNLLLEFTIFKGNYYGVQLKDIPEDCIVSITPSGAKTFLHTYPDAICVYLELSEAERLQRLSGRNIPFTQEDEDQLTHFAEALRVDASGDEETLFKKLLFIWETRGVKSELITALVGGEGTGKTTILQGLLASQAKSYEEILILDLSGEEPHGLVQTAIISCNDYSRVKKISPPIANLIKQNLSCGKKILLIIENLDIVTISDLSEIAEWTHKFNQNANLEAVSINSKAKIVDSIDAVVTLTELTDEISEACYFTKVIKLEQI